MAPLIDIFPKKKIKIIKKPTVVVDYREKNSLVPSSLKKNDLDIEFKELKVADYLVNGVAIERKTISDFLSSMTNRRLLSQLEDLKQFKNPLLLIEGIEEGELYNDHISAGIHPNAIRGFLLSIALKHRIPLIFTKNPQDTANFISVIAKKKNQEELSLNTTKKPRNKKEQLQFILEGFPGIGPKTSKKLLEEFNTIKNIVDASEEDLKKVLGKKSEIFKLFHEIY